MTFCDICVLHIYAVMLYFILFYTCEPSKNNTNFDLCVTCLSIKPLDRTLLWLDIVVDKFLRNATFIEFFEAYCSINSV